MDKKLHILHHLYDEADDAAERERLLDDPALRAEFEAMASVKSALDARPKPRPEAAVLEAVVVAAAPAAPKPRADRPPQRRLARRYRLLGTVTAMLALLLVVGIGLQQMLLDGSLGDTAALQESDAVFDAPSTAGADEDRDGLAAEAEPEALRAAPPPAPVAAEAAPRRRAEARGFVADEAEEEAAFADDREAPAEADAVFDVPPSALAAGRAAGVRAAVALADTSAEALPAWDEADAVLRVHTRLELLEARSSTLNWDEVPAVSLDELPPASAAPRGVRPVRQRRDGHR